MANDDEIMLKIYADTTPVLALADQLRGMVWRIRQGRFANLDDTDPYALTFHCETAEGLLMDVIDDIYEGGYHPASLDVRDCGSCIYKRLAGV